MTSSPRHPDRRRDTTTTHTPPGPVERGQFTPGSASTGTPRPCARTATRNKGFVERSHRELQATGETRRKRTITTDPQTLTAQEAHIARLARDGHSNPDIGTRLFISTRTVEYHLQKVFTKLNVQSRGQLNRVLAD